MEGRGNELIPMVKWKYIENVASTVIGRNRSCCGIITGGRVLYEPLPDIERRVRSYEGWS